MAALIGIVIVAHEGLASGYKSAVEHVLGPQDRLCAIGIAPGDDRAARQDEVCRAADRVDDGAGVIVVTDLFGASPSNLSLRACTRGNRAILYGANLPMLVKLMKSRDLPMDQALNAARNAGRRYINSLRLAGDGTADADPEAVCPAPLSAGAVQAVRAPHPVSDGEPAGRPRRRAGLMGAAAAVSARFARAGQGARSKATR